MESDKILEFFPIDVKLSTGKNWDGLIFINALGVAWWALFNWGIKDQGFGGWVFLSVMLLLTDINIILFSKQPLKLTLNTATGTLQYDYVDFFLREKSTTVYLRSAYFEYKPYLTKGSAPMRLLIYNNYFKNQVAIKVAKKGGFTREQLDAVAENIRAIQAKLGSVFIN